MGSVIFFFIKMNGRLCGYEIKQFDICIKCSLTISTICNCCKNIFDVQTHVPGVYNGL